MTARERIDAAIAARPRTTTGEWLESSTGNIVRISGEDLNTIKIIAGCESVDSGIKVDEMLENATLIAAAPDLVEEVIRLRKWQQEAVEWLYLQRVDLPNEYAKKEQRTAIDRLIAEAQED